MKIVQAEIPDFESVRRIVQTTIWSVYPRYYPSGAVVFFARHHSDESIAADIARLFVLPEHQHRGYGKAWMDFAERLIAQTCTEIVLDVSFPAKRIYRKRGYVDAEYHTIQTDSGDFLCYDVM